mmetsp:Transcript_16052/g.28532  ORF Transcript_16052/g.28532 Transcript_16052/m.28532 type:complete len:156 (-) Transcript_16052:297-764(-)
MPGLARVLPTAGVGADEGADGAGLLGAPITWPWRTLLIATEPLGAPGPAAPLDAGAPATDPLDGGAPPAGAGALAPGALAPGAPLASGPLESTALAAGAAGARAEEPIAPLAPMARPGGGAGLLATTLIWRSTTPLCSTFQSSHGGSALVGIPGL